MKATGIVRRIDDLGRIVIPKEIRRNLGLREGEAMEISLENDCVCFKKYSPPEEDFAVRCQKYVSDRGVYIKAISFTEGTAVVFFANGSSSIVKKNSADDFDMNIALCYAFAKAGFTYENPVCK